MRRRILIAVALLAVSFLMDGWAYDYVVQTRVYEADWGRLLRVMGFWPLWGVAAFALWLCRRGTSPHAARSAWLLALAPAVAALAAEILKLTLRRERPGAHAGEYFFREFGERSWSTSGLAMPSSHVMVAFGGAAMLAYLFPRARWVWFGLAAGCALTRVLAQAHFASDVVVAAVAALATTAMLWRWFGGPLTSSAAPQSPAEVQA